MIVDRAQSKWIAATALVSTAAYVEYAVLSPMILNQQWGRPSACGGLQPDTPAAQPGPGCLS
jgi:hypothetical protein